MSQDAIVNGTNGSSTTTTATATTTTASTTTTTTPTASSTSSPDLTTTTPNGTTNPTSASSWSKSPVPVDDALLNNGSSQNSEATVVDPSSPTPQVVDPVSALPSTAAPLPTNVATTTASTTTTTTTITTAAPNLASHLYHVGFREGRFHDILLHVPAFSMSGGAFQVHRLVIARSPILAQLLEGPRPDPSALVLPLSDANITPDAFAIALGWLYSEESIEHMHSGNATGVLASAHALGLANLAGRAVECIQHDIQPETVGRYAAFVDSADYAPHTSVITGHLLSVLSSIPQGMPRAFPASAPISREERGALVSSLTALPFRWFKRTMELPQLGVNTDHERYFLAKECVAFRRAEGRDEGMEESVVLAFGGGAGGVTVVRRPSRIPGAPPSGRTLWKIQSSANH